MNLNRLTLALIALLLIVGALAAQDTAVKLTSAAVATHPSQGNVQQIEGGQAELFTTEAGATMSFRTDALEVGHVYTAWWVIVNNPENCTDSPCAAPDILTNTDLLQSEVTQADAILVSEEGTMEFAGFLAAGAVDADEAWYGNGFTNPTGAEIHIVINDHGPLISDMTDTMLNTYRGGCQDEGLPKLFPPSAIEDGQPGPNTCRLVQFAVFQQTAD